MTSIETQELSTARWGRLFRQVETDDRESSFLVVIAHPDESREGDRFEIESSVQRGLRRTLGRAETADLSFPDVTSVSRLHAELEVNVAGIAIRDRGSTNGTFVNDEVLRGTRYLRSGDVIAIGEITLQLETTEAARQAEALYRLVNSDELTGAFNRRRFEEMIVIEVARAERYDRDLSLILFDIDHFKNINDTYGHATGDRLLARIVEVLRPMLRKGHLLARIGGDEFAILCPEVDAGGASQCADRLRRAIGERLAVEGIEQPLSCSFGVTELGDRASTAEQMQVEADKALYRAKDKGRDAVSG